MMGHNRLDIIVCQLSYRVQAWSSLDLHFQASDGENRSRAGRRFGGIFGGGGGEMKEEGMMEKIQREEGGMRSWNKEGKK